ncbi:Mediator of RNA polymerase II transcription subunit 28 [Lamellibrachia satsuma]|nr:Mediator of RNA polymerase II transcription subunit 28 [Lamellibrachia satsuma]
MMATPTSKSPHLVEELETAFQNCLSVLTTQEQYSISDSDEVKTSVELSIQKFLDIAKQLECCFLQKRLVLSIHKPEQIIKEDISELKQELQHKETLIEKHYKKLHDWQSIMNRIQSGQIPETVSGLAARQQAQTQPPAQMPQPMPGNAAQVMPPPSQMATHASYSQGPLASLEQTTSNIGMMERQ